MNYIKLRELSEKKFFDIEDLQDLLKIKRESVRVLCSRFTKNGFFIRIKRNFYVLNETWENFNQEDFLKISNLLQVPSYVSFLTALSVYELTTQVPQNQFESAALKRSTKIEIKDTVFNYYKLKPQHYFSFVKKDGIFIATKEKAFIDSVHLYSFGRYRLDFSSIDFSKLDKNKLKKILEAFPKKTKTIVKKLCKI